MTFEQAAAFIIPIGKHKGKRLDDVAQTDGGLRYLDWLRGERGTKHNWPLDNALAAYLDDTSVSKELAEAVKRR